MNPAVNCEQLLNDLTQSCRIMPGDIIIVHASMKAIGWVEGGPQAVIAALQQTIGPTGTLLMPTYNRAPPDGRIDLRQSACRTGLLAETFRKQPGVVRSAHPTHSVAAWGKDASAFIAEHSTTSGLGERSPFHLAALAGADVLMIGCNLAACSLVHVAEALVRVPYLGKVMPQSFNRAIEMTDTAGSTTIVPPRDVPGDSHGFSRVQHLMEQRRWIHSSHLGSAPCLKFNGNQALDAACELLRDDPASLLCHRPHCRTCVESRRVVQQIAQSAQ